jgi:hypothetical protein
MDKRQTIQWPKEKVPKEKKRTTKHFSTRFEETNILKYVIWPF